MSASTARLLGLFAAAVLVAGCGGHPQQLAGGLTYSSVEDLAGDLGCSNITHETHIGATDGGSCTDQAGDDVAFSLFEANLTRNNVIILGINKGKHYVFGDRFLVACTSGAEMRRVAKLLPGSSTQD